MKTNLQNFWVQLLAYELCCDITPCIALLNLHAVPVSLPMAYQDTTTCYSIANLVLEF